MDDEGKVQIYYSIVFIKLYCKNNVGGVFFVVCKVVSFINGWGWLYFLIGDCYVKLGCNCDDWIFCLVILVVMEKYCYVKFVDGEVVDDVDKCLSQYYGVMLEKQEGFMCNVFEGQQVFVGCGIGEIVIVCFKD